MCETKICSKCGVKKPLSDFYMNKNKPFSSCKSCVLEWQRRYNKTETHKKSQKRYEMTEKYRESVKRNNIRSLAYKKKWYKNKAENDPLFRIKTRLRVRFHHMLIDYNMNKRGGYFKYLGCTYEEFKEYLTSKFKEGMSWENYGEWHIDHIIPLNYFNLFDESELYVAWNWRNLQPLWESENCSKQARVMDDVDIFIKTIKDNVNS